MADNYGRRFAFYGLSAVFIIATIMEMLATNWQVWLASKLFVGWGQGMAPTIILVVSRACLSYLCATSLD